VTRCKHWLAGLLAPGLLLPAPQQQQPTTTTTTYIRVKSLSGKFSEFVCARVSWAMKMKEADRRLYLITDAHDSYKNIITFSCPPSSSSSPLSSPRRQQLQQQQQHGTVNCSRPMHHPSLAELPSDMMKSNRSSRERMGKREKKRKRNGRRRQTTLSASVSSSFFRSVCLPLLFFFFFLYETVTHTKI
jgi:hypothetical protein